MTFNRMNTLLALAGLAVLSSSNAFYLVNPGERALIMNNFTGLKSTVYDQGWHLLIPFIEVPPPPRRSP